MCCLCGTGLMCILACCTCLLFTMAASMNHTALPKLLCKEAEEGIAALRA